MTRDWLEVSALLEPRFSPSVFCGFMPPDGWLDLSVEIHERLLPNPDYRIVQVKEKFGGLRFYCDGLTDEEEQYVWDMERLSHTVCQFCGSRDDSVATRGRGWVRTACASCETSSHR